MKKSSAMVVLGFLILSLTVVHVQADQGGAMTSATLKNPVAIDGKWTFSNEWTDALQVDCGWGWVALKDDTNSFGPVHTLTRRRRKARFWVSTWKGRKGHASPLPEFLRAHS